MRFTRNVHFEIKPGKTEDFRKILDNDIVPMLRKQDGFKGELALVNDSRAIGISLWENEQKAENYRTNTYPRVLEMLQPMIQGSPSVENFEVAATTLTS